MRKYAKSMAVMAVLAVALPCFAAEKVVTKWKTVVDSDVCDDGRSKTVFTKVVN